MKKLPAELQALLYCSSAYSEKPLFEACIVTHQINWDKFYGLLARHRVTPLVYKNLKAWRCKEIPETIFKKIEQRAKKIINQGILQSAEMSIIAKIFKENNIEAICFKGPALSQLLYDNPTLREYHDIDILVQKNNLYKADCLLKALNYQKISPHFTKQTYLNSAYQCRVKDYSYKNQRHCLLELHWKFYKNLPYFYGNVPLPPSIWSNTSTVTLHQSEVSTLDRNSLLLYLFTHGYHNGWFRIHWLIDVYDYLKKFDIDLCKVDSLIDETHSSLAVQEGLFLLKHLLQFETDRNLIISKKARKLAKNSLRLINHNNLNNIIYKLLKKYREIFLIKNTLRNKLKKIEVILCGTIFWHKIPLPRLLFPLYYLLCPLLLLWHLVAPKRRHKDSEK